MSATRHNQGKVRLDLIPPEWELELGKVFTQGAEKYDAHNWLKGMPYSACVASAKRHMNKFMSGEKLDEESGCPHLAHVAWNVLAIMSYERRGLGVDDLDPLKLDNLSE